MLKLALLFLLLSLHARLMGLHDFAARAERMAVWLRNRSSQVRGLPGINLG